MLGFLPNIGLPELGLILLIVLLIFGPGKLPQVAKTLGKGIRDFRSSVNEVEEAVNLDDNKKNESS